MNETPAKKGMSTGAKWGVGCGIGCLTLVVIIGVASFFIYRFAMGKLDEMTQEMTELGFENVVTQQVIEVTTEITEPTLYLGQVVKILADCSTNLAVIAQIAEIHGKVEGKVYFRGQVLTIQPNGELMNGLDVLAQGVQNLGTINGEITGQYQEINSDNGP